MAKREKILLVDWLDWIEGLYASPIELGLERVQQVAAALALAPDFPIVIVGGTNGKGSVCALLSTMLARAGFRVGTYTSPHILRYNERVALDMQAVNDDLLIQSFAAVEAARKKTPLTYFEFGTLAAMQLFVTQQVEVAILEVGLGGRLDAVNVFEPDVSIVVNVDLDHQSLLGADRESIGFEKAGIFRSGKPAICADYSPPASLVEHARVIGADLLCIGRDFDVTELNSDQWAFQMGECKRYALPFPLLRGHGQLSNAAAALAALACLAKRLPVDQGAVKRALSEVDWPARFQVLPGRPQIILDGGHNPHAVRALVAGLHQLPFAENRYAVFAMLADKDIKAVVALTKNDFEGWFVSGLDGPRGQSAEELAQELAELGVRNVQALPTVADAWYAALSVATENDRIVVFGSFYTVAAVMKVRQSKQR